jgi:hypothetical protein
MATRLKATQDFWRIIVELDATPTVLALESHIRPELFGTWRYKGSLDTNAAKRLTQVVAHRLARDPEEVFPLLFSEVADIQRPGDLRKVLPMPARELPMMEKTLPPGDEREL